MTDFDEEFDEELFKAAEHAVVEEARIADHAPLVGAVLEAVEPLIRADERAKVEREEVMIYARAWDEVTNEVMAKVEAYERLLNALAPVVRWGCAPALGGGLTDVDGVWASEIFKVLPELEPYVLALIEKDSDD